MKIRVYIRLRLRGQNRYKFIQFSKIKKRNLKDHLPSFASCLYGKGNGIAYIESMAGTRNRCRTDKNRGRTTWFTAWNMNQKLQGYAAEWRGRYWWCKVFNLHGHSIVPVDKCSVVWYGAIRLKTILVISIKKHRFLVYSRLKIK